MLSQHLTGPQSLLTSNRYTDLFLIGYVCRVSNPASRQIQWAEYNLILNDLYLCKPLYFLLMAIKFRLAYAQ